MSEALLAAPPENAIPIRLAPEGGVEAALAGLPDCAAAYARAMGFSGKLGRWLILPGPDGAPAAALAGWGDAKARARTRFALGAFAEAAPAGVWRLDAPELTQDEREEAALGWLLSRYRFTRYRDARLADARLVAPEGVEPERVARIARGVFLARDLINTPAEEMGPAQIEEAVFDLAARHGAAADSIVGDALLERGFPLIHAVGRAAARPPRLVGMEWGDEDAPRVTLVGKGVAFDTGGLNLKPGGSMGLMKKDMGGAANVLGLASMILEARLPVRLRVLIPAVENAVSGAAMRPGDVLRSRKGLTVEINNTDAEGRLVLADALALADEESPDLLVDMATLTGAARVALGPELAPFYTDDDALAQALSEAAQRVRDPLWRMPLWPGYEPMIEPAIADLDNAPAGGFAGSITAALFLRRFVERARAWAHFDIYAWNPKAAPGRPKGGEAQGVRALFEVIARRYGGDA
ncbi:leucyl aminopeptidase family protein [Oceanicella actignis]|uniref:Leucyl aminopeptidase n=1 Tax=Oceanicella actignis TaxID=1189325 RepID=A0A1M7T9F2_9RHOB|nr:leucyl aminopeptidase family protein [Oceanicella actignis]SET50880.1 leucyl aminopeptidase [Oceanicella actignis]SHN67338.1 leucyl aminopeptidase [Oceanicella actignis]